MDFATFFKEATGHAPYPYQRRLAEGAPPNLLDIPTGLGKTQAILGSWLFHRLTAPSHASRRLVYCLPMRVLVQQTYEVAQQMLKNARHHFAGDALPQLHLLQGGDVDNSFEASPESPAIIIGTQDLLLSRALNRGYAMSRYKWPMHFALLNNDVHWVFDEVQLMGVGVETSAQLQGLRAKLGSFGTVRSTWASATLAQGALSTVDHRKDLSSVTLQADDYAEDAVTKRLQSQKMLVRCAVELTKTTQKTYGKDLATEVIRLQKERQGLTLVVLNRVGRAQDLFEKVQKAFADDDVEVGLLHSRFREAERAQQRAWLEQPSPNVQRVLISTQVVEAGVDLSAKTLVTELCPWSSFVQRVGRCNRDGRVDDAQVHWIDVETTDAKNKDLLPYEAEALAQTREHLQQLSDAGKGVGPGALKAIAHEEERSVRPVVRRKDILDLFDTSSDLSGEDLDVSRFVRDPSEPDVFVYWRNFTDDMLLATDRGQTRHEAAPPRREELCRVSLAAMSDFLGDLKKRRDGKETNRSNHLHAITYDVVTSRWTVVRKVRPGMTILLDCSAGGYDVDLGWQGKQKKPTTVPEVPTGGSIIGASSHDDDPRSFASRWVTLAEHLGDVRDEASALGATLGLSDLQELLAEAGLWHDVGKAHPVFQARLTQPDGVEAPQTADGPASIWAKSNHNKRLTSEEAHRRAFRHELASMLAYLEHAQNSTMKRDAAETNLVAYLVLAHHGKVRVQLRSLPDERPPPEMGERLLAHGVLDGDVLPAVQLADERELPETTLSLDVMQLGSSESASGESWTSRVLGLRDAPDLGPFRLTLLESVVRVADWRASAKEQRGDDGKGGKK